MKNIGIFGRRNAGKSSLINALLGQDFAIVSPEAGTTTDPVKKRMEIPGAGPCNLIDTAGMDDAGEVGNRRVEKSRGIMDQADLALLVFSGNRFGREEESLLEELKKRSVPVIAVHNRSDQVKLEPELAGELQKRIGSEVLEYSCCAGDAQARQGMRDRLLVRIAEGLSGPRERGLLEGLVNEKDRIVLVCPVDSGAPHGRLILPQVMAIRDILDRGATAVVVQPSGLEACLRALLPISGIPANTCFSTSAKRLSIISATGSRARFLSICR